MNLKELSKARDRSVIAGIGAGVMGRIFGLLAPFLVMPVMLKHLGQVNFGIWMTAVSVTSMAMFLDFGIGNGLLTKLSKSFGESDFFTMRRLISTGYVTLVLLASFAAILLSILFFIVNGKQFAYFSPATKDGWWIIFVTGISFLVGIPVSVIQRVMLACQNTVSSNVWQIIGSIVGVVCCYGVVKAKLPAGIAIAAYSISPIVIMLLATFLFFSKYKNIKPSLWYFSFEKSKDLMALGSKFFFLSIITSIALNSDNLIIAYVLGANAVTEYSIPAKLASVLGLLVTTMFLPLWAANAEAMARKDYCWVRQTARRMTVVGGLSVGGVGLLLALFSEHIITIWMGRHFTNGMVVVTGFSLMYMLFSIASPSNMILNSVGNVRVQIKAWIVYLFFSSGLKLLFLLNFHRVDALPYIASICYLLSIVPIVYFAARSMYIGKS